MNSLKEELKQIINKYALELNISDNENELLSSLVYSVVKSEEEVRNLFYKKIVDIIIGDIIVHYNKKREKIQTELKVNKKIKKKILN